jgi:hypothetical protein
VTDNCEAQLKIHHICIYYNYLFLFWQGGKVAFVLLCSVFEPRPSTLVASVFIGWRIYFQKYEFQFCLFVLVTSQLWVTFASISRFIVDRRVCWQVELYFYLQYRSTMRACVCLCLRRQIRIVKSVQKQSTHFAGFINQNREIIGTGLQCVSQDVLGRSEMYWGRLRSSWTGGSAPLLRRVRRWLLCQVVVVGVT